MLVGKNDQQGMGFRLLGYDRGWSNDRLYESIAWNHGTAPNFQERGLARFDICDERETDDADGPYFGPRIWSAITRARVR